jgi:hypothetical protein
MVIYGPNRRCPYQLPSSRGRISSMLRIDQVPKIEAHVIKIAEGPGGIGETGATAGPPALRNPIYAANGVALRRVRIDRKALATSGRHKAPSLRFREGRLLGSRNVVLSNYGHEFGAPYRRSEAASVSDFPVASFFVAAASALSSGWVSSHSARAAASGSIPVFRHQDPSLPRRWTSR